MIRRSFYDDINDRAREEFGTEKISAAAAEHPDGPLWKEWVAIWWKHANAIVQELKDAGLELTAISLSESLRKNIGAEEYMK